MMVDEVCPTYIQIRGPRVQMLWNQDDFRSNLATLVAIHACITLCIITYNLSHCTHESSAAFIVFFRGLTLILEENHPLPPAAQKHSLPHQSLPTSPSQPRCACFLPLFFPQLPPLGRMEKDHWEVCQYT